MNFSPFGGHFPASLPSMHQFATKFTNDGSSSIPAQAVPSGTMVVSGGDGIQYLRPDHASPAAHFSNQTPIGMPADMGKYVRRTEANPHSSTTHPLQMMNPTTKYHAGTLLGWGEMPVHHFSHGGGGGMEERSGILSAGAKAPISIPYCQSNTTLQQPQPPSHVNAPVRPPTSTASWPPRQNVATMTTHLPAGDKCTYRENDVQPQDLCKGPLRDNTNDANKANQVKPKDMHVKREKDSEENKGDMNMGQSSGDHQSDHKAMSPTLATSWECLSASAQNSSVADYLSRIPASSLPISLHHFLKYSTETVKKEQATSTATMPNMPTKKKKKKKVSKEKKPRPKPGEIRISTALDGSTLFCCPECHMAYPEKEMLEQHMAGHKLERRFICDICGAGLKRKEHLDQHKRGHSQERPFVCTICLKGFKRNEHLTRHYVIHSGDKNHMCTECGKAFSRKDHLHKHVQTHIAKRVKAELSQQGNVADSTTAPVLS